MNNRDTSLKVKGEGPAGDDGVRLARGRAVLTAIAVCREEKRSGERRDTQNLSQ